MASTSNKSAGNQPKYTWWHGLGLVFMVELPQRHMKVISRSQQGQMSAKPLKIAYFVVFCYNYVHLRCLWWLETDLDLNTDLYQNTWRGYRGNIRVCGFLPQPLLKSPSCHPTDPSLIWQFQQKLKIDVCRYLDQWPVKSAQNGWK